MTLAKRLGAQVSSFLCHSTFCVASRRSNIDCKLQTQNKKTKNARRKERGKKKKGRTWIKWKRTTASWELDCWDESLSQRRVVCDPMYYNKWNSLFSLLFSSNREKKKKKKSLVPRWFSSLCVAMNCPVYDPASFVFWLCGLVAI